MITARQAADTLGMSVRLKNLRASYPEPRESPLAALFRKNAEAKQQARIANTQAVATTTAAKPMTERPILFSAPMVRAILAGTKTQTRRVCKQANAHGLSFVVEVPDPKERGQVYNGSHFGDEDGAVQFASPYGATGDRLWVREAWAHVGTCDPGLTVYRADYPACVPGRYENVPPAESIKWKPSIHMFRADSRITLEVADARVERLQDISEADAIAEGISEFIGGWWCEHDDAEQIAGITPQEGYRHLWERINGAGSWEANPWVWVVEFRRITQ
jgi:hypothetical protein